MESFQELWALVQQELQKRLSEVVYQVWLSELVVQSFDENNVTLQISAFKRRIVEQKFYTLLCEVFEQVLGFAVEVSLVDASEVGENAKAAQQQQKAADPAAQPFEYTFETFVVGSSNKFAHAAAQAVAANPGGAYNPLFIYGNSGLGKTHLLHAICYEIRKARPQANIILMHGEDFTNEIVYHIGQKTTAALHNKYRSADVLLVDDVQFIAGRESTQEEFFHTFNALTQSGNQIVLTSDRPPKAILTLEERLRTRFEWGLIADVQPPDLETRMAIIQNKAQMMGFEISDDVVRFIAEKLNQNIRQLEGAVKKMQAYAALHGAPHNLATAKSAIKDILSDVRPIPVTVERVIEEVARTFGHDPADIRSKKRDAQTSKMRQISMYVVSKITNLSTKAIGAEFGGRDHSTVIYALREITAEMDRDASLRDTVEDVIKNVQEH